MVGEVEKKRKEEKETRRREKLFEYNITRVGGN